MSSPAPRSMKASPATGTDRFAASVRKLEMASTGFDGHRTVPDRASSKTSSHVDGGTGSRSGR